MLTISLEGMHFRGFIGVYPEEKTLGNELLVDVFLSFEEGENITDLRYSIDYETVYAIVKKEISFPRDLLEELAQSLLGELKKKFPFVEKIKISVKKLHPPLMGETARSCITLYKEF